MYPVSYTCNSFYVSGTFSKSLIHLRYKLVEYFLKAGYDTSCRVRMMKLGEDDT